MRNILLSILLGLAFCSIALAQQPSVVLVHVQGPPTSACSNEQLFKNDITGDMYDCVNGAPHLLGNAVAIGNPGNPGIYSSSGVGMTASPIAVYASAFPGADACAKIATAIAALGPNVNVIGDFSGNSNCGSGLTVTPGACVTMNGMTLTISAQIVVNENACFLGPSPNSRNGLIITAANGLNADPVLVQSSTGSSGFVHYSKIGNFYIEGNAANQASGYGITFVQMGENGDVHDIEVHNAHDGSFHIFGSLSGSTSFRRLSGFRATNGPCLFFDAVTSSTTLNAVHCGGNSGAVASVKAGTGGVKLTFVGLQQEGLSVSGSGEPFFLTDGTTSRSQIVLINGAASSTTGTTNFIKHQNGSSSNFPAFVVENFDFGNTTAYPTFYNDTVNGDTVSLAPDVSTSAGYIRHWESGTAVLALDSAIATHIASMTLANGANENIFARFGDQNHNGPSTSIVEVAGPTGAFSLGGIISYSGGAGGVPGQWLILQNPAALGQVMTINNEDVSSTAANRITTGSGANFSVASGGAVSLFYDGGTSRWLVDSVYLNTLATGDTVTSPNSTLSVGGTPSATALDVKTQTTWLAPWSGNSATAMSASNNAITGRAFVVDVPISFSNIYAVVNTQDATGTDFYTLAIANSSGAALCHSTSSVSMTGVSGSALTYPCSEGAATLLPGNTYILLSTGSATTGKVMGTATNGYLSSYYATNITGCTSASGVISFASTCSISLSIPSVVPDMPVIYLH